MGPLLHKDGRPGVSSLPSTTSLGKADRLDIIFMLILGVLFVAGFFFWESYIINKTTRPPLMRLKLWTRAKGRLAAVYFIGFISWMGFSVSFYPYTCFSYLR